MSIDRTGVDHDVRIRPARSADLEQLRALDLKVFQQLAYPYFVLRQLFDVHRDCWLVAEHSSGLVGYSLGVPTWDRSVAWLLALAVDPEYRRLGHGRQLTLECLNLLTAMDVLQVCLTVQPSNETAITLYRQVGFFTTGMHRNYLGPGEDRLIMTRPLADVQDPASQIPAQADLRYAAQYST